jgi:hypothetical protein
MDMNLDNRRQRLVLATGAATSIFAVAMAWIVGLDWVGHLSATGLSPIEFGLQAIALAAAFGPLLAVEAVSHERLTTSGVDPLGKYRSRSFELNQLFLRGTIEQWILFAAGVLGLAVTVQAASAHAVIFLATIVWTALRIVFRIAYIFGSEYRGLGLGAHAQSMAILLYVVADWSWNVAGVPGQIVTLGLFTAIEAALVADAIKARRAEQCVANLQDAE